MKTTILACLAVCALPTVAAAQPALAPMPPPAPLAVEQKAEPKTSINVSPLGVMFGNYAVTFEHLFNGSHGLILEGVASRASDGDSDSMQFGGSVGYRWHWRGRQNSGFLGATFTQSVGSGSVTVDDMKHSLTVRSTMVTANIGKRWMVTDAVNVTLRFGLGWGHHVAKVKSQAEGAQEAEELMNDLLSLLPIGAEGELSVGYTF